jgi:hypothetical protein
MAASTLDLDLEGKQVLGKGHGTEALGPSDTTDSGSDLQGAGGGGAHVPGGITPTGRAVGDADLDSDTDATGTGERAMAGRDSDVADNADIGFDRVVRAGDAGLGGGLDQAEEAWAGRLDEEADLRGVDEVIAAQDAAREGELRGERSVADVRDDQERTQAADAAIAGGVDADELMDQMHAGSDSEGDARHRTGGHEAADTHRASGAVRSATSTTTQGGRR